MYIYGKKLSLIHMVVTYMRGSITYDVRIRGLESQARFKYMYSFSSSPEMRSLVNAGTAVDSTMSLTNAVENV